LFLDNKYHDFCSSLFGELGLVEPAKFDRPAEQKKIEFRDYSGISRSNSSKMVVSCPDCAFAGLVLFKGLA
jgi:hypothetical protein